MKARLEAEAAPPEDGGSVYEHKASDFQEGVVIHDDNSVTGKSKYATGVTEFEEGEQDGNFLVLTLKAKEGVTIKTKVIGGTAGEKTVSDGFCLYRIADAKKQQIQVTYEGDGDKLTEVYDLSQLVCEPKPD